MTGPFKREGELWLCCQEGGYADPAFMLRRDEERMFPDDIGWQIHADSIAQAVIDHFNAVRCNPLGDRRIGRARITIELLED